MLPVMTISPARSPRPRDARPVASQASASNGCPITALPAPSPDHLAVDRETAAHRGQIETRPVRGLRPQHDAEVEGVVGHQREPVEAIVVDRPVVDDLDGRRKGGHCAGHRSARVPPAGEIRGQAHRDLGLDPDTDIVAGVQGDRAPIHVRLVDAAGARMIDAREALHDRRGQCHLPAGERPESVLLVEPLQAVLDRVRFLQASWPQIRRQAGKPLSCPVLVEEAACRGRGALPVVHPSTPKLSAPRTPETGRISICLLCTVSSSVHRQLFGSSAARSGTP